MSGHKKIPLPWRGGFGRRRVSRRFWEAVRLASLLGGGASRVAFQEIPLLRRGSSGRRRVSRRFSRNSPPTEGRLWEAVRLASLLKKFSSLGGAALGGGASRVAFQEIPHLRRAADRRADAKRQLPANGLRPVSPNKKAAKVTA